jgi:hypothetical protein
MVTIKTKRVKRQSLITAAKPGQQALGERNRLALAYLELAKDKTFQHLSEEEKLSLIKEVIAVGDEVARVIMAEHGTNDPRKIATRLGVRVVGEDCGKARGSEYHKERKEIIVYRDYHEKLLREIRSTELADHLLKFVVAHQLFHHLEVNRVGEVYKRYKFPVFKIGPYVREKQIKRLSNVAAQAFTQSLIGLEISPQIFDYLAYVLFTAK